MCIGNDGAFHFRYRAAVKQSSNRSDTPACTACITGANTSPARLPAPVRPESDCRRNRAWPNPANNIGIAYHRTNALWPKSLKQENVDTFAPHSQPIRATSSPHSCHRLTLEHLPRATLQHVCQHIAVLRLLARMLHQRASGCCSSTTCFSADRSLKSA